VTGRVCVHTARGTVVVEPAGAQRLNTELGHVHVVHHDVEVHLLRRPGSGQAGGRSPGARWKARPDVVAPRETTTQSSDSKVRASPSSSA
jgi:hypothetical protein